MNTANKQSRNRNSHILSEQGLNKINEAIGLQFPGKQPAYKEIEEYILQDIEERKADVPNSQIINNILSQKKLDIAQIHKLFQVLELDLAERDIDKTNLSVTGYKKLERAIKKIMSDKANNSDKYILPNSEYIEERIKREIDKETIDADTIKKIVTRQGNSDRRKIEYLFKAFRLKLTDEDLTSKSIEANNYNREQLCKDAINQNLPIPHNKFIGRKEQLKELMRCLSDDYPQPIIQVDGIGGVGKTALVLEAAYMCLEKREGCLSADIPYNIPSFASIIWTSAKETELQPIGEIPLQAQRTLQEIYRTIAKTLDNHSILYDADGEHLENIINKLKKTPGKNLLVIDNLETISDKEKVLGFIRELHNTKIVITTRQRAYYPNISLDALADKESKQLIRQQSDIRNLKLTDQQQQELCQASSGLPLAIIYTVGRLSNYQSLSEEMFKRVINELANPEGDLAHFCFKKSVNDIKNSLSYQLLMALAIFDQSSSYLAMVEVAGLNSELEDDVLKSLDTLQTISLIRCDNGRYKMLPITREYTIAQLKQNIEFHEKARDRWVEYYINYAKVQYESQSKEERFTKFYAILDNEWKNFLGVLRFCKDRHDYERVKILWSYLNNYSNVKGYWQDRLDWLKWLIETSLNKKKYRESVHFMVRRGRVLLLIGKENDLKRAETTLLQAWELRQYAEFADIDYMTNHLAGLNIRLGNYEQAHQWLEKEQANIDAQIQLAPEERIMFQVYLDREKAEVLFYQEKYEEAEVLCQTVIENSKIISDYRNEHNASKIIADIALDHGDLAKAEPLLQHGFAAVSSCHDRRRMAYYLVSLAKLEKKKGNLPEAKKHINQAISHFDKLGMARDFQKAKNFLNELKEKS
jgi:hypothetical protein